MLSYPLSRFKLVSTVVYFNDIYGNNRHFTIVLAPMSYSSRQFDDISLSETVDLLMLISELMALALALEHLGLPRLLNCCW